MLLSDPVERAARAADKRARVLDYLSAEVWSSAELIGRVAGIQARQAVHRMLTGMEGDDLIRRAPAPVLRGQGVTLWGITPTGRALCPTADPLGHTFEPSKLSLERVPHQLLLQELRLAAEAAGWTGWTRGETLGKDVSIRPDAMALRLDGHRFAIEAERTIKTAKRYQNVIQSHIKAIHARAWVGVYYVCPPHIAAGLERMFQAIRALPGGGEFTEGQRNRFRILRTDQWPPQGGAKQEVGDA